MPQTIVHNTVNGKILLWALGDWSPRYGNFAQVRKYVRLAEEEAEREAEEPNDALKAAAERYKEAVSPFIMRRSISEYQRVRREHKAMTSRHNIKIVNVTFEKRVGEEDWMKAPAYRSKKYNYLCDIPDIEVGDLVVTDTPAGWAVCRVREVFDVSDLSSGSIGATKWVVDKIDVSGHRQRENARLEEARVRREVLVKRRELNSRLEQIVARKRAEVTVDNIVTEDPEAALLAAELRRLEVFNF